MGFFSSVAKAVGLGGGGGSMGSILGGGIDLVGSVYQNYEARKAADTQMDFQRFMSNTAYRRQMMDMRRAGLNPILAAGGPGASTPSGATYNPVNTATAAQAAYYERKMIEATVDKTKQETETGKSVQVATDTQAQMNAEQARYLHELKLNARAERQNKRSP